MPSVVTITFSGFRSPCTTPSAWAAAIPDAIWRVIDKSESVASRPGLRDFDSGSPAMYSMLMIGTPAESSTA